LVFFLGAYVTSPSSFGYYLSSLWCLFFAHFCVFALGQHDVVGLALLIGHPFLGVGFGVVVLLFLPSLGALFS